MIRGKRKPVAQIPNKGSLKILCVNTASGKTLETTYKDFKKDTEHFWTRKAEILSACEAAFTQTAYPSGNSNLDGLSVRWEQQEDGVVKIIATIQREETTSIRPQEEETLL
jgi:molybdopterin biosynthesis enzyme